MTNEMAKAMLQQYTTYMRLSDKLWNDATEQSETYMHMAFALDRLLGEFGYEFKKSYDGTYVIVEK